MTFKSEINISFKFYQDMDILDVRKFLRMFNDLYHQNINLNMMIVDYNHPFDALVYEKLLYVLIEPILSELIHNRKVGVIIQTNFIEGEDNFKSINDMMSFIEHKYSNHPVTSIMVSNALNPINCDTEAVMNLLSKKYDFPLSIYLNPSSLDLNFNKKLNYLCDANNCILLPAFMYYERVLTEEELLGYVNILNKNKLPFKFTIDLYSRNYVFQMMSRIEFITSLLKSNNGIGMVVNINYIKSLGFDYRFNYVDLLRHIFMKLDLVSHPIESIITSHPTTGLSVDNVKEDYITKSNPTTGLSIDNAIEDSNTSWIDRHFYKSLKIVRNVSPYQLPPSYNVLYNLGENNRVCVETLHLKKSYKFARKFIQARLIDEEIFVTQEFFSGNDHNITLFSAWLEFNPHIICIWQLDFKGDIVNVGDDLFEDTNFKLSTITVLCNPTKQPLHEVTPLQSIEMNASEHRQYILDTLEYHGYIELISDEDYDDSRSILAYREEFYYAKKHFDILLTSLSLSTMNLHKDLLIELKSLWEAAICAVSKFEVDQALPILEWLPAMWMQVIGCPDNVRSRVELLYILYVILSDPKLAWTQEAIVESLMKNNFRKKIAQWTARHIFDHYETFERDLWDISEPIDWNSYLCIFDDNVIYKHLHYNCAEGNYRVTPPTKLELKVVDHSAESKIDLNYFNCGSWNNLTPKIVAMNIFDHIQDVLKVNENCYFLGHCTTEESVIRMSKYGMSPYAGFGNKMSCGHGMYFFKMSKTNKTFDDFFVSSFDDDNESSGIDDEGINDINKEFQGFIYALSTRVEHIKQLAVMLFLINENDVNTLNAFDTTKIFLPLRKCYCDAVFNFPEHNKHIEYNIVKGKRKNSTTTTNDTINAVNLIKDDLERFNIFALISGVVDFSKIPNGIFRGNIFDGGVKSTSFPPVAMPYWLEKQQQFGLWKKACSSPIKNYRRMFGYFDTEGKIKTNKKQPEEMWEYVFVSSEALQELLNHSIITIAFIDSDAKSTTEEFCDSTDNLNECEMDQDWLKKELIKVGDDRRHSHWTLRLRCDLNLGECSPKL